MVVVTKASGVKAKGIIVKEAGGSPEGVKVVKVVEEDIIGLDLTT